MTSLIDKNTRLVVQGITGSAGAFHAKNCMDFGTNVVAGVTPGKGGQLFEGKVPVFDTVAEAKKATDCNASMIFVPPPFAADAIMEAADAGVKLIVCITEGIPVQDMQKVKAFLKDKDVTLIGPNCPGIVNPAANRVKIGTAPLPLRPESASSPVPARSPMKPSGRSPTWAWARACASVSAATSSTRRPPAAGRLNFCWRKTLNGRLSS